MGEMRKYKVNIPYPCEGDLLTDSLIDYEKTSLKPYVDLFRRFVAALVKEEMGVKREREEYEKGNAMEF